MPWGQWPLACTGWHKYGSHEPFARCKCFTHAGTVHERPLIISCLGNQNGKHSHMKHSLVPWGRDSLHLPFVCKAWGENEIFWLLQRFLQFHAGLQRCIANQKDIHINESQAGGRFVTYRCGKSGCQWMKCWLCSSMIRPRSVRLCLRKAGTFFPFPKNFEMSACNRV